MIANMDRKDWRKLLASDFIVDTEKRKDYQSTVFFGEEKDWTDHYIKGGVSVESFHKSDRSKDYKPKDMEVTMLATYVVVVEFDGGQATSFMIDPASDSIGIAKQQRGKTFRWGEYDWGRWENYLSYGIIGLIKDSGDQPESVRQIVVFENATVGEIEGGWSKAAPSEVAE